MFEASAGHAREKQSLYVHAHNLKKKGAVMELDRRSFLGSAAVLGSTTALGGIATHSALADEAAGEWSEEHDIVIVGGGGAGIIAAIAASEADPNVDVVIYEKLDPERRQYRSHGYRQPSCLRRGNRHGHLQGRHLRDVL